MIQERTGNALSVQFGLRFYPAPVRLSGVRTNFLHCILLIHFVVVKTDSAEKPSCYFLVLGEMAGAAKRRSRKSERPSSCHWTSSPASKSSAAASGKGMLT